MRIAIATFLLNIMLAFGLLNKTGGMYYVNKRKPRGSRIIAWLDNVHGQALMYRTRFVETCLDLDRYTVAEAETINEHVAKLSLNERIAFAMNMR
jgi:hypothetical protein